MKPEELQLRRAVEFIARNHVGFRKMNSRGIHLPYPIHAFDVMKMLVRWGAGITDILAGGGHDLPEEEGFTETELVPVFGAEATAMIIEDLTFIPPSGLDNREVARLKAEYMQSFFQKRPGSIVVKVADRLCNVSDFVDSDLSYARKYMTKADSLFDAVHNRSTDIVRHFGPYPDGDKCWDKMWADIRRVREMLT